MRRLALLTLATCAGLFALLPIPPAAATPFNWNQDADGQPVTLRWPAGTTIHIYIPDCPDDEAANDSVRAGIQKWSGQLAAAGITLQFHMGQSMPPGATNSVDVQWVAPGTFDPDDAQAEPLPNADSTAIGGGTLKIECQEPPADYTLVNNGIHEGGHLFGLDNDPTPADQTGPPNVMDPNITDLPPQGFSARDSAEFRSLYGPPPDGHAQGEITGKASGDLRSGPGVEGTTQGYLYEYWVSWMSGPELPTFEVSLNCPPATVLPLAMPPNWVLDYPPVYTDVVTTPLPNADTPEFHYRSTGAGLSAAMPVGYFSFTAPWPPGPGWAQVLVDNDGDGAFDLFPVPVPTGPVAVPDDEVAQAPRLTLLAPVPNPSADAAMIRFVAPRAFAEATIEIFDPRGARVWSSRPLAGAAGLHFVVWDGRTADGPRAPAGIYFCTVRAAGERVDGLLVRVK